MAVRATWSAGSRAGAIWKLRCPRCGRGNVFASTWAMNRACPECGDVLERGPGYFTGAMDFSYALGIPIIALATLAAWLIRPTWPLTWLVGVAWPATLPLVPAMFRYSRVMFLHFDRMIDPEPDEPPGSMRDGP